MRSKYDKGFYSRGNEATIPQATTMQPLPEAWRGGSVECSNCGIVLPLRAEVLDLLREQAAAAQAAIDTLRA